MKYSMFLLFQKLFVMIFLLEVVGKYLI